MPDTTDTKGVAVTGASGFVGAALVKRLLAQSAQVVALSRTPPTDGASSGASWRELPALQSDADFRDTFSGVKCIVHCAARVHVMNDSASDPLAEFRRINRDGTLAVAEAAASAGVERFVFVSSIKVNGEGTTPGAPYHPDDPPRPVDPYGISKREAEDGLRDIEKRTGMAVVVVRPVLVYGPGVKANFAAIARLAASGLPLPLGAADNRRSLVFLGNLVDLLARLATGPLPDRRVFLASDGAAATTADLVRMLAAAQDRPARLLKVPPILMRSAARLLGKSALTDRLFGWLETDSAHLADAGWHPPFSMTEGLARSVGREVRHGG